MPISQKRKADSLWESIQDGTHHRIKIAQRLDKRLLLSLYEQDKQVCSMYMGTFGIIEDEHERLPNDSDIVKKVMNVMQPIAEKFASNKAERAELYELRDESMKRLSNYFEYI